MAFEIGSGYIEKSLSIYEDPTKTLGPLDRIFFKVSSIRDIPKKLGPERGSETKKTWLTNIFGNYSYLWGDFENISNFGEENSTKNGIGVLAFHLI